MASNNDGTTVPLFATVKKSNVAYGRHRDMLRKKVTLINSVKHLAEVEETDTFPEPKTTGRKYLARAQSRSSLKASILPGITAEMELQRLSMVGSESNEAQADAFVFHPHSSFLVNWDVFQVLVILLISFVIPFYLSFDYDIDFASPSKAVTTFAQVCFLFDILLKFNTGLDHEGSLILSRRTLVLKYLTSWFLLDFVSAIPIAAFTEVDLHSPAGQIVIALPLLRVAKVYYIMRTLEYSLVISSPLSRLLKFIFLVIVVSHWFGCIFAVLTFGDEGIDRPELLTEGTILEAYVTSYYWAIMTMTTVGFGDVPTKSTSSRAFSIFAMIVGGSVFAYGITDGVALVTYLNISETSFRRKIDHINEYMEARRLPISLRSKVREYFYFLRKSKDEKVDMELELLDELSGKLRIKVAFAASEHLLQTMPFFAGSDPEFFIDLYNRMYSAFYPPKTEVFRKGDLGREMYFIIRGSVEVTRDGQRIATLSQYQHFAELRVLDDGKPNSANVSTLQFCELFVLENHDVLEALELHPGMRARIREMMKVKSRKPLKLLLTANQHLPVRPTFLEACATHKRIYEIICSKDMKEQEEFFKLNEMSAALTRQRTDRAIVDVSDPSSPQRKGRTRLRRGSVNINTSPSKDGQAAVNSFTNDAILNGRKNDDSQAQILLALRTMQKDIDALKHHIYQARAPAATRRS